MDINQVLGELGLTKNQTNLYLALLKHGIMTAGLLAKKTAINRSTVYIELEVLIRVGLVSFVVKDHRRIYRAADPSTLLEILDVKRHKLTKVLPSLQKMQKLHHSPQFHVDVFEGKEGIKTFYQHILQSEVKEVLALGVTGYGLKLLAHSWPQFMRQYIKAGVRAKYIANYDAKKQLASLPTGRLSIKYMPKKKDSQVTTVVYGDFVAHQSVVNDRVYVVLIEDLFLAMTYRNHFDFIWDQL
jgi:sugar-specific transcriptional regulator TrmB